MSLSAGEARARANRIAATNRLIQAKARVQRQKDEFKAQQRRATRDRQDQDSERVRQALLDAQLKDKRDMCLCVSCFILLVFVVNLLFWQYYQTRRV